MAKKRIDVEIGVKNKVAAGLKQARASIRRFSQGVKRSMGAIGLSFRRIAAIGVASFAGLIKHGNDFRTSMAEVQTMLGSDKSMLPKLTRQVRELSAEFGLAKDTLAKGLYQALSAGVPANNAIEFLRVASKSAVGGVTDVATSVDGLTSVLNAYGIEASKVSQVSDLMFTVVKEGKINFEELSQNIGNIAPFAKVAQVGIEDLSAMIATLVKVDKPERAMTSLRQAMVFAAKAGKPLMQVLNEFEGKTLEDLMAAGVTQKSAAGIAIMSGNMKVLRKEMEIFANTAGAANDAFNDVTPVRSWQRLWQSVLGVVSTVGEEIDKQLAPAINALAGKIKELTDSGAIYIWAENVKTVISGLATVFENLGTSFSWVQDKIQQSAAFWGAIAGGASTEEATQAMESVPKMLEKERQNRLEEIRLKYNITESNKPKQSIPQLTNEKIGLGNMAGGANGVGGATIGANTSMLSTGDLFTMMQAGTTAQRDNELSELQAINQGVQELIKVSGGLS